MAAGGDRTKHMFTIHYEVAPPAIVSCYVAPINGDS